MHDDRLTASEADRTGSADGTHRPRLTVVSGPAGVGKGTVVARLAQRYPQVWVSVSATTRAPRAGEVDGVHYYFVDDARFSEMIAANELLEWAVVHGVARYGTPRAPVLDALARGQEALLEIDLQGARQVRASWPQARFVFLTPPSWDELTRRLAGRGTETREQQERRLTTARAELDRTGEFEHTLVNDDVDSVVARLVHLMGLSAQAPDRDPEGSRTASSPGTRLDPTIREGCP